MPLIDTACQPDPSSPRNAPAASGPGLRRALTLLPLVFYGLSIIVGAGIYIAIGAVIERAGYAAPLSFLFAGIAAGLTGLCYAELASRFPEAGGAASYVKHGFGSDRLAQLVGAIVTLAVGVAAAAIARGSVAYLATLVPLPVPILIAAVLLIFTLVAMAGVRESVGIAALLGGVEIAGLVVSVAMGLATAPEINFNNMIPSGSVAWLGVAAGGFIAFFAFIGFESLANMAEEVKDPRRVVPRGIIGAIAASIVLYVAVATAVVLSDKSGTTPLLDLFHGNWATAFASVSVIAIANGVLVEIMMLGRMFYGMAAKGQLPHALARVHPRTQTPLLATALAGTIVLIIALLVPFDSLLVVADALTLCVFAAVDWALFRVRRVAPSSNAAFTVPLWIPPLAAVISVALVLAELLT